MQTFMEYLGGKIKTFNEETPPASGTASTSTGGGTGGASPPTTGSSPAPLPSSSPPPLSSGGGMPAMSASPPMGAGLSPAAPAGQVQKSIAKKVVAKDVWELLDKKFGKDKKNIN